MAVGACCSSEGWRRGRRQRGEQPLQMLLRFEPNGADVRELVDAPHEVRDHGWHRRCHMLRRTWVAHEQ